MRVTSILCALSLMAVSQPAFGARPDFVVILVDDMGFSDLACYGSEISTPNIDKLAAGGMRLCQFSSQTPFYWEHLGNAAVRGGRWKLVRQGGGGAWQRYDLSSDRSELNNLAAGQPERVQKDASPVATVGRPRGSKSRTERNG